MKRIIAAALFCILPLAAISAQTVLVRNSKPKSQIVLADKADETVQAAGLLQDFVHRISGARLPIVSEAESKGNIFIGGHAADGVGEDGFSIDTENGNLHIKTGGDKGAIYGVVTLLERYLGVSYWAYETYDLTESEDVVIPEIHISETPAFRYRQSQNYGLQDPVFKMWYRFESPGEEFIDHMWVHTFNRLLPSDKYGKTHPEYYSFINGERRPGHNSQWCLTNPAVFDAVVEKLDSIFKANPDLKMISVSQNDGNFTHCACPECKAVEEYEGAPSGNYIRFLNKLAQRFPDKEFSTLAYLFTMDPPKHVKPLPNVNIMLCNIDCKREVPLTDNASGRHFVKALEGWSAISDNIFLWDYGINFDGYLTPFPNFHTMQKNIRLYKENDVTMHFSQVNGSKGGDFSELRAYMLSKLMWDPYQDVDSLMTTFLNGYYGKAGAYINNYLKMLEGALLSSGKELWIYDSAITHKDGMLNPQLIKTYNELFDKAEAAVADDPEKLRRVRLSRLSIMFSELEIARTYNDMDVNEITAKLNLFEERTEAEKVPAINERRNTPGEYCNLYRERFLPQQEKNKALGAKVTWILPPHSRYRDLGETALTDGLYGGSTYVESWVGWEGENAAFILDMGEEKEFSRIESDFLHQLGAWVLLPVSGRYSISSDGEEYSVFGRFDIPEDRDVRVKFTKGTVTKDKPVKARYIKVEIEGTIECPYWHYGIGFPSWFFIDEVFVN